MKEALKELLDAIVESEAYRELEAGCEGEGPVVRGYYALGEPLPTEIQDWFKECDEMAEGESDTDKTLPEEQ